MVTRAARWLRATSLLAVLALLSACAQSAAPRISRARPVTIPPAISPAALFVEPDDGIKPLIARIDGAQRAIYAEAYILTDSRIVHALERAAAQGVDVRVVLEERALGMGTQPRTLAAELTAAGVQVRPAPARYTLLHSKFMVFDDRQAWLSTANFSRSAFASNREFGLVLTGEAAVLALSNVFRHDWDDLPGPHAAGPLVLSPGARPVLLGEIASARHEIDMDEEEMLDGRIEHALEVAAARGVQVRVLLPTPPPGWRHLLHAHVAIRILTQPYMHAKVLWIDGRVALIGSENVSAPSLDTNREVGVIVRGPSVRRVRAVFLQDWRAAQAP